VERRDPIQVPPSMPSKSLSKEALKALALAVAPKIAAMTLTSSTAGKKKKKKQGKRKSKAVGSVASQVQRMIQCYAVALMNPFFVQPPSLGFGRFDNKFQRCTAFVRFSLYATTSELMLCVNPWAALSQSSGANTTLVLDGFVNYSFSGSSTALWNVSNTFVPAANNSSLLAIGDAIRIVSGGVRAQFASAMTNVPCVIGGGLLNGMDSPNGLDTLTTTKFPNLPCIKEYTQKGGIAVVEQIWAPMDVADMQFVPLITNNAGGTIYTNANPNDVFEAMVIFATGMANPTRITIEVNVTLDIAFGNNLNQSIQGPMAPAPDATMAATVPSAENLIANASQIVDSTLQFSDNESYSTLNPTITTFASLLASAPLAFKAYRHLRGTGNPDNSRLLLPD
jgi:hypothetical protein